MKVLKAVVSLIAAIGVIALLNTRIGPVPPVGKFLDPFDGFWHNAESKNIADEVIDLKGLTERAEVSFDDQMIPHVFARNDHDLYFAQGYVTARHRLWQMDFQTRFAGGRLSEVIGPKALELDRYQRRMGMVYGGEQMLKELDKYPRIKAMTQAYAEGVNAYIQSLKPGEYPIEFKILNYKPEKWTPLNTALLLKLMSAVLAGGSDELYMSNALQKLGRKTVEDLFPNYPFKTDPIIPEGTKWEFTPLPVPPEGKEHQGTNAFSSILTKTKEEGIGSNNWAVSGSKTLSGYPMLANDPHLELSLPSIWYQIQLAAPGVNAYGVSIPGAPCIIIGYNERVAWGVTNVNADVLDFYRIRFRNGSHQEYWYNKQWKKTSTRLERIKIRGSKTVVDTVYYTSHGPVVYLDKPDFPKSKNIPEGYALRWIAHDPSADVATFYYLNRARNYQDYRKALTFYTAPAQNFAFASSDNDIAITANGYLPLKWPGQGKYLLDGSKPTDEWHGRIPQEQNPTVRNPARGFVSSANQPSTDRSYPYYINWEFSGYERAHRINTRLASMSKMTVDSMRYLQNDNYSILAEDILDTMVRLIKPEKLTASETRALRVVRTWNKRFDAGEAGASIFEIWQKNLYNMIWTDELGDKGLPMRFPSRDRTVKLLLQEGNSRWFDDIRTPVKENRADIIQASFKLAVDSLERRFGPMSNEWRWANVKQSHVPHLAKIAGFGSKTLYNGGSKTSVNALGETHGPSWRMVVALGNTTKGYGIFPGGESGNPGSFYYDNMISTWTKGQLCELLFLKMAGDKNKRIVQHITLEKK